MGKAELTRLIMALYEFDEALYDVIACMNAAEYYNKTHIGLAGAKDAFLVLKEILCKTYNLPPEFRRPEGPKMTFTLSKDNE